MGKNVIKTSQTCDLCGAREKLDSAWRMQSWELQDAAAAVCGQAKQEQFSGHTLEGSVDCEEQKQFQLKNVF